MAPLWASQPLSAQGRCPGLAASHPHSVLQLHSCLEGCPNDPAACHSLIKVLAPRALSLPTADPHGPPLPLGLSRVVPARLPAMGPSP